MGYENLESALKLVPIDGWIELNDQVGVAPALLRDHFEYGVIGHAATYASFLPAGRGWVDSTEIDVS